MMENKLYPLKFKPILKDKIWGGEKLKKIFNKVGASEKCGESWEISGIPGDVSIVSNGWLAGNTLEEIVEIYMGDLVGEGIYEKYGNLFPLLVKFIDANDDLSIQVHPDDKLALEKHSSYGKTEMWYVIDAEKNSELVIGFNREMNLEDYLLYLGEGKLEKILNRIKVEPGNVFYMPAGRVHAIGAGVLLAEIQQTSDITYRIYDYKRKDDKGNERELHTEFAKDAIDFTYHKNYKTEYEIIKNNASQIIDCNYFTTNLLQFDNNITREYHLLDSFVIYMCLNGEVKMIFEENEISIKKGETVLIPAIVNEIELNTEKEASILEVYVKDRSNS